MRPLRCQGGGRHSWHVVLVFQWNGPCFRIRLEQIFGSCIRPSLTAMVEPVASTSRLPPPTPSILGKRPCSPAASPIQPALKRQSTEVKPATSMSRGFHIAYLDSALVKLTQVSPPASLPDAK